MDEIPDLFDLNFTTLLNMDNFIPEWAEISDQDLLFAVEDIEEKKENERFATLNENELKEVENSAQSKGTKRNTKCFIKAIEGKGILFS